MNIIAELRDRNLKSDLGDNLYARAANEIERLRKAGLRLIQHENGGSCMRQGGEPCREADKCGCYLEFQRELTKAQ